MLTLNTQILFKLLIKAIQPSHILDIGSMDGKDALMLKRLAPGSKCFAFEANPKNYISMIADPALSEAQIEVINKAVSSHDGAISFYVAQENDCSDWRKGTSSLLKRNQKIDAINELEVQVESLTLNSFIKEKSLNRCALWIDVEGAAYQVLSGADAVTKYIFIGHVEVENNLVWTDQRDAKAVLDLLTKLGFCAIARGRGANQHDLVFVRKDIANKPSLKFILYLALFISSIKKYLGKLIYMPIFNVVLILLPKGFISLVE